MIPLSKQSEKELQALLGYSNGYQESMLWSDFVSYSRICE